MGTPDTLSETGSLKSGRSRRYTLDVVFVQYEIMSWYFSRTLPILPPEEPAPLPSQKHRIKYVSGFWKLGQNTPKYFSMQTFTDLLLYLLSEWMPHSQKTILCLILDNGLSMEYKILIFSSSRKNFANFRQSSLDGGMSNRSFGASLSRARPSNR